MSFIHFRNAISFFLLLLGSFFTYARISQFMTQYEELTERIFWMTYIIGEMEKMLH